MLRSLGRWLAPAMLAGLLLPAIAAPATLAASQHTLTLDPSFVHWGADSFHNDLFAGNPDCDLPGAPLAVGYVHEAFFDIVDTYKNCVYESAVRFDLSALHQYAGAVITKAQLSYEDDVTDLRRGDFSPAGDTYDLNQDAVWNSCVANVGVPNEDWRGEKGLVPYTPDDTIERLDRGQWDVTSQARNWYAYPDYLNNGLMLLGYDEGTDFSNNAHCLSSLGNLRLQVDFVASDPTPTPAPTPTPNLAEKLEGSGNQRLVPTPTPVEFHRPGGAELIPTPTTSPVNAIGPALPDLVIRRVDTASVLPSGLVQVCGAGRSLTFTVHVSNIGNAATTDFAVVSLSVDGVPRATTTVGALAPGAEKTVSIGGMSLSAGTHSFSVTVNDGQKLAEADVSNNSFSNNQLVCS